MKKLLSIIILNLATCAGAQIFENNADFPRIIHVTPITFAARRDSVLKKLPAHSVAVFRSAEEYSRTASAEFPFRQSNAILYLCGYSDENATLVISSDSVCIAGQKQQFALFVPERNKLIEQWTGKQLGPGGAESLLRIPSYPNDSLDPCLRRAFATINTLYYDWLHPVLRESLPMKDFQASREEKKFLLEEFPNIHDVEPTAALVDTLRMIKSSDEIALMKRAIQASCNGHRETMKKAHPGMHEYELAAIFDKTIADDGCESQSYPDIVGSGPNSCYLHYSANRRRTLDGELVLMDCGGEYEGYAADITRTFPINGTFTPEQRAIYDIVLKAQTAGIAEVKPGAPFNAPHKRAFAVIHAGLAQLGIIHDAAWAVINPLSLPIDSISTGGNVPEVFRYFMHGTSHTLGMDVHDPNVSRTLSENEVLTVEPGIYIPEDSPCDKKWWNIGVRIEDDILVTKNGSENLSAAAPRSPEDIEELMKK